VRLVELLTGLLVLLMVALSIFLALRTGHDLADRNGFRGMIFPMVMALLFLGMLLLARRSRARPRWLAAGIVALVVIDIVVMNVPWVMVKVNPDDLYGDAAASRYVASLPGTFRVETDALTMYRSLDNGAIYGLEKATGDDSLVLKEFDRFRELILPQQAPGVAVGLFHEGAINSPMLDAQNDKYFMTKEPIDPRLLAPGKIKLLGRKGDVYIYVNTTALPRAWMSPALAFSNNEFVFAELARTRGSGLHEAVPAVLPAIAASKEGARVPAVAAPVRLTRHSATDLVFTTTAKAKGLLVVSELYYPGWQAYVDGVKVPTVQAALMLRGVMLKGNQKTIEFRFEPTVVRQGAIVSIALVALLVLYGAALLWGAWRRRARERREAVSDNAGP